MNIYIHGKEVTVQDGLTVTELMRVRDIPFLLAVELNGEYLERKLCHTTVLQEQDRLEFIESLSGG